MEGYPGARFGFADVPLLNPLASSGLGELPRVQAGSVADAAIICLSWRRKMKWAAPRIVEVPVGMEINMYACANRAQVKRQ